MAFLTEKPYAKNAKLAGVHLSRVPEPRNSLFPPDGWFGLGKIRPTRERRKQPPACTLRAS